MRYPVLNLPASHLPARHLRGLVEDYAADVDRLKKILSDAREQARQEEEGPRRGEPVYHPPGYPPLPEVPSGGVPNQCYQCPDGSVYWGQPRPGCTPVNATEFVCRGAEYSQPLEMPPPPVPTDTDLPGTGMPPISVSAGDEIPPPVPVPPSMPGGHAPVSTGIPTGPYGEPPVSYPPELPAEEDPCPPGTRRVYPQGPCEPYAPVATPAGGTVACYSCNGRLIYGRPTPGCVRVDIPAAECLDRIERGLTAPETTGPSGMLPGAGLFSESLFSMTGARLRPVRMAGRRL